MSYTTPLLTTELFFAWYEETTYKTRPTNINRILKVLSHDIASFPRAAKGVHYHGSGREPDHVHDWKKWDPTGNFTYEVVDGQFITLFMGACVTTGTDPYTHTITAINTMMPSFAMQTGFQKTANNVVMEFLGCRVNSATLKLEDEKLVCDIEYMLATPQDGGASFESPTFDTTAPYIFKVGTFSSTSLYAGAKARVYGFEWKINNNAKHDHVMGHEHYPFDVIPHKIEYELTVEIGVDDDTEWDEVIGAPGTSHDFEILFTRGANDTLKISGSAKLDDTPWTVDENNVRATLQLVPSTTTIEVIDSIASYPLST